ncbi:6180_t:CDS:2 [Dentiscutata erythropus]|uniref:6180_t:CDS:1 n=1 Tax=Dentiscutata erythropus TaxID=1348616 RepID=A0A9N9E9B4_9GLOM|nr:6180_t:CDS:2 [Dentiscutata erythropus]
MKNLLEKSTKNSKEPIKQTLKMTNLPTNNNKAPTMAPTMYCFNMASIKAQMAPITMVQNNN